MVSFDDNAFFTGPSSNDNTAAAAPAAPETPKAATVRALLAACRKGNAEKAKSLLDTASEASLGIFQNLQDASGDTPMHLAVQAGASTLVQLLDDRKFPADKENNAGLAPLAYAARANHGDIVRFLIRAGAAVNRASKGIKETPLITAAYWGAHEAVQILMEEGSYIDAKDANGATAAMRAAGQNHVRALGLLVRAGADLDAISGTGRTARDFAERNKAEACLRLLRGCEDPRSLQFLDGGEKFSAKAPRTEKEGDTGTDGGEQVCA